MIKLSEAGISPLMYLIMIYKVDNKVILSDVDKYNNHLPFMNNADLRKLIH